MPDLITYTVSDPEGHDRHEILAASPEEAARSFVSAGDYPAECGTVPVRVHHACDSWDFNIAPASVESYAYHYTSDFGTAEKFESGEVTVIERAGSFATSPRCGSVAASARRLTDDEIHQWLCHDALENWAAPDHRDPEDLTVEIERAD